MRRAIASIGILLMSALAHGSDPPSPRAQARTFVSSIDGTEQPYNLYIPTTYQAGKPMPLVVALHGKGATWRSWFDALPVEEWAERHGFLLATPHGRGNWFYLGPGEADVFEVMRDVKSLYAVDESRQYLIGHSMGGFGTWHLGVSHPDVFAAIVPMATWAPLDQLAALRHTPVLVIHGDGDAVVPIEWGERAVTRLLQLGINHRWIPVPALGHESMMITAYLPTIAEFLRDKYLAQAPATVSVRAYTPRRGKAWWVSLQEVEQFTQLATIDATMTPNRIDIVTSNVRDFAIDPPLDDTRAMLPIRISIDNQLVDVPPTNREEVVFLRKVDGRWSGRLSNRETFVAPQPKPIGQHPADMPPLPEIVARIVADRVDADAMLLPNDLIALELPIGTIHEDHLLDIFLRPEDEICLAVIEHADAAALLGARDWYPSWWGGLTLAPDLPPMVIPTTAAEKPMDDKAEPEQKPRPLVIAVPRILAERLPVPTQGTGISVRRVVHDYVKETGALAPPAP